MATVVLSTRRVFVAGRVTAALVALALVAAACSGGAGSATKPVARPARAMLRSSATRPDCPLRTRTLAGVWHPQRLVVLRSCQRAAGRVIATEHEQDGDVHLLVLLDRPYLRLVNSKAPAAHDGGLVVELMPRDGGHLPVPAVGDRIGLVGAWVFDTAHGWDELHPVFGERLSNRWYSSGPRFGGSPASASGGSAADECRTQTGSRCLGYAAGG